MNTGLIAAALTALRQKKGLFRRALGEHLPVSPNTIAKWEREQSLPSIENLMGLADLYGVSIDQLLPQPKKESTAIKSKDGMTSLTELYKIGSGPSSSHTIGPEKAAMTFRERYPEADRFKVILYGSLANTGKGHGTDAIMIKAFSPIPCEMIFDCVTEDLPHPNTMELFAYEGDGRGSPPPLPRNLRGRLGKVKGIGTWGVAPYPTRNFLKKVP